MSRKACKQGITGFTLIEVLVAFVILATSLLVVFKALSGGMIASGRAPTAVEMALEARSLSERLGAELSIQVEGSLHFRSDNEWTVHRVTPVQTGLAETLDEDWVLYRLNLQGRASDGTIVQFSTMRIGRK